MSKCPQNSTRSCNIDCPIIIQSGIVHVHPKGKRGERGDRGPEGLEGLKGPTGHTGPVGDTGLQGLQGSTGLQGLFGEEGDTGIIGEEGPQGIPGVTGNAGETGDKGLTGEKGQTGPKGETGEKGATGNTGIIGNTGINGAVGASGSFSASAYNYLNYINDDAIPFSVQSGDSYFLNNSNANAAKGITLDIPNRTILIDDAGVYNITWNINIHSATDRSQNPANYFSSAILNVNDGTVYNGTISFDRLDTGIDSTQGNEQMTGNAIIRIQDPNTVISLVNPGPNNVLVYAPGPFSAGVLAASISMSIVKIDQ